MGTMQLVTCGGLVSLVTSIVALPLSAQRAELRPFAALGLEAIYTADGGQFTPGYVGRLGLAWNPAGRWGARLLLSGQQRQNDVGTCLPDCREFYRSRIYGAELQGTFELGTGRRKLNPYLLAGLGIYQNEVLEHRLLPCPQVCTAELRFEDLTGRVSAVGFTGGFGLEFLLGKVHMQAEAAFTRFTRSMAEPHVLPITLGVRF